MSLLVIRPRSDAGFGVDGGKLGSTSRIGKENARDNVCVIRLHHRRVLLSCLFDVQWKSV
jgi:hypothetical protein